MMGFLVKTFACFKDLAEFVPKPKTAHPAMKSEIVPMKILFKDEKYKSETIDILSHLMSDANLSGNHQVIKISTDNARESMNNHALWTCTCMGSNINVHMHACCHLHTGSVW